MDKFDGDVQAGLRVMLDSSKQAPVFGAQCNLIQGGWLLAVAFHKS